MTNMFPAECANLGLSGWRYCFLGDAGYQNVMEQQESREIIQRLQDSMAPRKITWAKKHRTVGRAVYAFDSIRN